VTICDTPAVELKGIPNQRCACGHSYLMHADDGCTVCLQQTVAGIASSARLAATAERLLAAGLIAYRCVTCGNDVFSDRYMKLREHVLSDGHFPVLEVRDGELVTHLTDGGIDRAQQVVAAITDLVGRAL
jgi:hypothetical protein